MKRSRNPFKVNSNRMPFEFLVIAIITPTYYSDIQR